MRFVLLIFMFFSLSCHSVFKKTIDSSLECPSGIGSSKGDMPKVLKRVGGTDVIACGWLNENSKTINGKERYSEFDVYYFDNADNELKKIITKSALENYNIFSSNGSLFFDELIWHGNKFYPAVREKLICKNNECEFIVSNCIFQPNSTYINNEASVKIKEYISGDKKTNIQMNL